MNEILESYNQSWKEKLYKDKETLLQDFDEEDFEFLINFHISSFTHILPSKDWMDEDINGELSLTAHSKSANFKIYSKTIYYGNNFLTNQDNLFQAKYEYLWEQTRMDKRKFTSDEYLKNPHNQKKFRIINYIISHFNVKQIIDEIEAAQKQKRIETILNEVTDKHITSTDIKGTNLLDNEFFIVLNNGIQLLVKEVKKTP